MVVLVRCEALGSLRQQPRNVTRAPVHFVRKQAGTNALLLWEPEPSVFPDGMKPWLGLPLTLHNRYFATVNNYTLLG